MCVCWYFLSALLVSGRVCVRPIHTVCVAFFVLRLYSAVCCKLSVPTCLFTRPARVVSVQRSIPGVRSGDVKMEPIPVEAPGSAGRYLGSLYLISACSLLHCRSGSRPYCQLSSTYIIIRPWPTYLINTTFTRYPIATHYSFLG